METNLISYNIKPPYISELNKEDKEKKFLELLKDLDDSIINYNDKKLKEQEMFLFNFPESDFLLNNKNLFYKTIEKFIEEIKKDNNNYSYIKSRTISFKHLDKGELKLTYEEICGFVNFIISIIDNLPRRKREETVLNFSKSIFPEKIKKEKIEINGLKLTNLMEKTNNIKIITVCLSNEKDQNVSETKEKVILDLKVIQLFCLFFKAFFINILYFNIDLNIYEINNYFNSEINPYKIKENEVLKLGEQNKDIFLANLIIMKNIPKIQSLNRINIKMYDSYQIELHQIMTNNFIQKVDIRDTISNPQIHNSIGGYENNNLSPSFQNIFLFFDHILPKGLREYYDMILDFNSLDPLLFSYVNLLLVRFSSLANISLKFFCFNKVNNRKILINGYYYKLFSNEDKYPFSMKFSPDKLNKSWDDDYKIYYDYINNINNKENSDFLLIKDEVILNELFPFFNHNLFRLLLNIETKLNLDKNMINSLCFDFSSVNNGITNLNIYNNYNSAIICFIFNLFYILESTKNKSNLAILDIFLDDLTDEKKFIIKSIQNKIPYYRKQKYFDLKELPLTHLQINISNISLFLPFSNFPMVKLTELIVDNLSFNDLDNLVNSLKNNNNVFKKLSTFEIGFNYMIEDFRKNLEILLSNCMVKSLTIFKLKILNNLSFEDIMNMLSWIKINKNSKAKYYLKIYNNKISPCIGDSNFDNMSETFKLKSKNIFTKRNIICDIKTCDLKKIIFQIKMLNEIHINYYLKMIYCFNKCYGKKIEKNKKIFENIFYYMGKFNKRKKEVEIEFI